MNFDPKDYIQQPANPLNNINTYQRDDFEPVAKNTWDAMLKQLEESNKQNTELKQLYKNSQKHSTLKTVIFSIFSGLVAIGLTILAVKLGWL